MAEPIPTTTQSIFTCSKNADLTMKAQWLHRQTEGIPALLLPMLTEYTIRDAFHIPQVPENLLKSWIKGLSPEQWSILQALTNGDRPLTATELKALIPSCTLEMLIDLRYRSLIKEQANAWNIFVYLSLPTSIDTTQ